MPATSKAQFRFMQAIAHGAKPKKGKGPTQAQAKEFVGKTARPKSLPEHVEKAYRAAKRGK